MQSPSSRRLSPPRCAQSHLHTYRAHTCRVMQAGRAAAGAVEPRRQQGSACSCRSTSTAPAPHRWPAAPCAQSRLAPKSRGSAPREASSSSQPWRWGAWWRGQTSAARKAGGKAALWRCAQHEPKVHHVAWLLLRQGKPSKAERPKSASTNSASSASTALSSTAAPQHSSAHLPGELPAAMQLCIAQVLGLVRQAGRLWRQHTRCSGAGLCGGVARLSWSGAGLLLGSCQLGGASSADGRAGSLGVGRQPVWVGASGLEAHVQHSGARRKDDHSAGGQRREPRFPIRLVASRSAAPGPAVGRTASLHCCLGHTAGTCCTGASASAEACGLLRAAACERRQVCGGAAPLAAPVGNAFTLLGSVAPAAPLTKRLPGPREQGWGLCWLVVRPRNCARAARPGWAGLLLHLTLH